MIIGKVTLEVIHAGDTAKLRLTARPFSHETPISLEELERLATRFAQEARDWRRARTRNYYAVLGVSREASAEEIQQAYRARAKQHHPDTSSSDTTAAMQHLNEAYAVLGDPQQQREYDAIV
jgi:DnaJ-domain-containing protein 1